MSELIKTETNLEGFEAFTGLKVYGTIEEPLFLGIQIQKLLGLAQINYTKLFDINDDYVKLKINTGGQLREVNMFTGSGLYISQMM